MSNPRGHEPYIAVVEQLQKLSKDLNDNIKKCRKPEDNAKIEVLSNAESKLNLATDGDPEVPGSRGDFSALDTSESIKTKLSTLIISLQEDLASAKESAKADPDKKSILSSFFGAPGAADILENTIKKITAIQKDVSPQNQNVKTSSSSP